MVYRAIGLMSGSSLDGLDIVFAEFTEQGGKWTYQIPAASCYAYEGDWASRLRDATKLSALDYQLLHTAYGHYLGQQVNRFIRENGLEFRAGLIASHGHTSFHLPGLKMTAQLGDGAAIAAATGLPVVSDLRAMDVALGGQGAPIVPVGEKWLMEEYDYFLNIGGIANIPVNSDPYIAYDICPANRVLNMLAAETGLAFDADGAMAATGNINNVLLARLSSLDYYGLPYPKSLANDFGTDTVFPLVRSIEPGIPDALRTYTEHIAHQVSESVIALDSRRGATGGRRLLVTGGGAFNKFLVSLLTEKLMVKGISLEVPDEKLVSYKEALIMAFIGVLRWRQEYNSFSSVTGASKNSIGGALWTGEDA